MITELQSALTGQTIEAFIIPSYTREELSSGPRIAVRYGAREMEVNQGPDQRTVAIEIGVVGVLPERGDASEDSYRLASVAACDSFDLLTEQVIALWTPNGTLSRSGLANHRFVRIRQSINFDPKKLYEEDIFLSMVEVTYEDAIDE